LIIKTLIDNNLKLNLNLKFNVDFYQCSRDSKNGETSGNTSIRRDIIKSRDASNSSVANNSRDATAGTPGTMTAERTSETEQGTSGTTDNPGQK
jgi:hypothetical protein